MLAIPAVCEHQRSGDANYVGGRSVWRERGERATEAAGKCAVGEIFGVTGFFVGGFIGLRSGQDYRAKLFDVWPGIRRDLCIAIIGESEARDATARNAAGDGSAIATIEDRGEQNSFFQDALEMRGEFFIEDGIGVGADYVLRNDGLIPVIGLIG